jgi:glycine betaine catabolism A
MASFGSSSGSGGSASLSASGSVSVASSGLASASASVGDLLSRQAPGYTLSQELHLDPDVYRAELERIWRPAWLFAAHSAELLRAGDRTVFDMGDDSVLIIRGQDEQVRAFHNVCRHRGSRLVDLDLAGAGASASFVRAGSAGGPFAGLPPDPFIRCPYHQWAYRFDGSLAACGGMDSVEGFEVSEHGLVPVECAEVGGLIFVRLDPSGPPEPHDPPGLAGADGQPGIRELAEPLGPQGLDQAKVAHVETYMVRAGWKVIWENNRECWHCHVGHPEYVRANFDAVPDTARNRKLARSRGAEHARTLGGVAGPLPDLLAGAADHSAPGLYRFPTAGRWWSANRTPLAPGFVTESLDGEPVAPLMGSYPDYDVGTLRVRTVPNFWCHASADHAVLTRLLPRGPSRTDISVQWLVDREAQEVTDYQLERLLPFWQLTSEQDWSLCERNQLGVGSPAYLPGPYSPSREYNVIAFDEWYLASMRITADSG